MHLSGKVMRGGTPQLCIAIIALAVGGVRGSDICERGKTWWDRDRDECRPCSRCEPARLLAVRLPCELHRDAVCQPLEDVRIWPFNVPKNSSAISDDEYYDYDADYDSEVTNSEASWDLQTSSLTLAASGCVVFFAVVLALSLYHAKEWRVLKRALKSDVQDLTAKLKLMEAGTAVESIAATDHHIYCNIHAAGKESLLGLTSNKKLGNVYTQDKHPS